MSTPINFPPSTSLCTVRIIDTTSYGNANAEVILQPPVPGHKYMSVACFAFLITNEATNTHVLFDLGIRKDWRDGYPAGSAVYNFIGDDKLLRVSVDKSITEILDARPDIAATKDISAAIWSHIHWDHRGDITLFPSTTKLVIGPGTRTYPTNDTKPESDVCPAEYEGREVHELTDSDLSLNIGGYPAHDFFGDGSFYLLSSPGHTVGHICGLARVAEDSFVFMGGDCAHHPGQYRPTAAKPLPETINLKSPSHTFSDVPLPGPPSLTQRPITMCFGSFVAEHLHGLKCSDQPFYKLISMMHEDVETAKVSCEKMQDFDADDRVLVIIGHDATVLDFVPFYPESLNGWKSEGVKENVRWEFLRDFELDEKKVKSLKEGKTEEGA